MQLPPLEVMAAWPKPNYDNPERRGKAVVAVVSTLFPFAFFTLAIRFYTRIRIIKSVGLDDWLIAAAMFPATGYAILALLADTRYGWDRHIWDVPLSEVSLGLKLFLTTQIVFTVGQTLTKCSMLVLIYRILSSGQKRFKAMTILAVVIIAGQGLIFIIVVIFQCRPPSHYWMLTFDPQPECINQVVHVTLAGSINTLTDLAVVLFPIPSVLKLHISTRQRIIVAGLFAAGLLVCVAGGVRTYYTFLEMSAVDSTWQSYYNWITACLELYVGIIVASIPSTKPFFKIYLPRLLDSTITSSRGKGQFEISGGDKGPFSASTTNVSMSQPQSRLDVELGMIHSACSPRSSSRKLNISHPDLGLTMTPSATHASRKLSMDLNAIEEMGVSNSNLSSFVNSPSSSKGMHRGGSLSPMDNLRHMSDGLRSDKKIDVVHFGCKESMDFGSRVGLIEDEDVDGVGPWRTQLSQFPHSAPTR